MVEDHRGSDRVVLLGTDSYVPSSHLSRLISRRVALDISVHKQKFPAIQHNVTKERRSSPHEANHRRGSLWQRLWWDLAQSKQKILSEVPPLSGERSSKPTATKEGEPDEL